MNILIALIPALGWGIFPLIAGKIKNSQPVNELMGLGTGALIVGIIIAIIHPTNSNLTIFSLSLISGIFWTIGQSGQFISMRNIGISKTMPLSTGLQLIGNTLIGAIIFGEWTSGSQYLIGTLALVLIIIGVSLTALSKDKSAKLKIRDIILLLFTSVGYWIYSSFPKAITADAQTLFLPQMIGIFIGISSNQGIKRKTTWLNIFSGFSFGIAAFAYIFSAQLNGVITAFIYSQLCVIISTLGGIFVFTINIINL